MKAKMHINPQITKAYRLIGGNTEELRKRCRKLKSVDDTIKRRTTHYFNELGELVIETWLAAKDMPFINAYIDNLKERGECNRDGTRPDFVPDFHEVIKYAQWAHHEMEYAEAARALRIAAEIVENEANKGTGK